VMKEFVDEGIRVANRPATTRALYRGDEPDGERDPPAAVAAVDESAITRPGSKDRHEITGGGTSEPNRRC